MLKLIGITTLVVAALFVAVGGSFSLKVGKSPRITLSFQGVV